MHTISAATIFHLAPASSMLRRGGPAQSAHRNRLLHGLAYLVLRKAQAVGGRVPLAAEHEQDLRHQLMRDR